MPTRHSSASAAEIDAPAGPPAQRSKRHSGARIRVVRARSFAKIDWLVHGFSTRTGGRSTAYGPGDLNLGFTASDSRENVVANRECFAKVVTGNLRFPIATVQQIHSALTVRVTASGIDSGFGKADGMMTAEAGILLAIQTADCIPVLIADRRRRAVAGFHAGWRGTLKRIVEQGVGRMRMGFGSRPEDLTAAIGPGIAQCCYSVGEEVRGEFESQFAYAAELFREVYESDPVREKYPPLFLTARAPGHGNIGPQLHLDLVEANRRQLLDAGLKTDAISVVAECTSCRTDRYFSYRAEGGFTGRMMSAIGIRQL